MAEISTEDAVDQLHQMFGDYDKATLAAVLEANGRHVERTVEHLLGNPRDTSGGSGGSGGGGDGGGSAASTDNDAALALQLSREWADDPASAPPPPTRPVNIPSPFVNVGGTAGGGGGGGGGRGGAGGIHAPGIPIHLPTAPPPPPPPFLIAARDAGDSGGASDRRGRRVALPEEFLRHPGWTGGGGGGESSDPQVAADARLAIMLQNQSFQRELEAHPDLAYLGRRPPSGGSASRGTSAGGGGGATGATIKEQVTAMGQDVRRKLDELAVRWKMKDPGAADATTEYSRVPLMSSQGEDMDDQAEVVHFSQSSTTRRSHGNVASGGTTPADSAPPASASAAAGVGLYRADSGMEEQLGE
eukprot:jgi/Undpi1/10715/HiC_scaffold_29.g13163.m1